MIDVIQLIWETAGELPNRTIKVPYNNHGVFFSIKSTIKKYEKVIYSDVDKTV